MQKKIDDADRIELNEKVKYRIQTTKRLKIKKAKSFCAEIYSVRFLLFPVIFSFGFPIFVNMERTNLCENYAVLFLLCGKRERVPFMIVTSLFLFPQY